MSQFKSHYRLTSRAGVYLKPYLVEVAHCAVKDKSNSYYAKKFEKISKRRGKNVPTLQLLKKF